MKNMFGKKEGLILEDPNTYTPAPQENLPFEVQAVVAQVKGQPVVAQKPSQQFAPRPRAIGKVFSINLESEGKKDWVVIKMVMDEKNASNVRVGQCVVMQ